MKDPENDDGMTAALVSFRDLVIETDAAVIADMERRLGVSQDDVALFMIAQQQDTHPLGYFGDQTVSLSSKILEMKRMLRISKTRSNALMLPYMDS